MSSLSALVLFVLLVLASGARADLGGFVIRDLHVDLTVEPDADLLVEERLLVDFSSPRHGIYRTIPVSYTDPRGFRYSYGFRLLDVRDEEGGEYGVQVSRSGAYYNIRIGDPERTVRGRVVYVIRYRVEGAVAHLPLHDEIYWNATGHEWQTDVEHASATVRLPASLSPDSLQAAGYVGGFGSQDRSVEITYPAPGEVRFESSRPLGSLEGMTVAVGWPHGHVSVPGAGARIARFLRDNWILLAPFAWFGILFRLYRRKGRDPAGADSVVVRYEPPEGLTPAEIGTIVDEKVDLRDITATVVDLAVRGYLTIREDEETGLFGLFKSTKTVLARNRERPTDDLLPHERAIYDGIFRHGDAVETGQLKEEFYKEIPKVKDALHGRLVSRGSFRSSPRTVRNVYVGLGVLAGGLTAAAGVGAAALNGAVFPHALVVPLVAGGLTVALFLVFAPAMPQRTRKGVDERRWALGFQEFVTRVDADRMERDLAEGISAREVFERLLPYAMALGVAATWAKRFQDIYAGSPPPVWYHGTGMRTNFSAAALERSLSSSMESVGRSMASTPRSSGSSGSGGGGFSGGGGGGGGGGSW